MLGYYRALSENYLIFWFQCSQDGFDNYAGSKFIVEFQVSETDVIGTGKCRNRIPYFLLPEELNTVQVIRNEIKKGLTKPSENFLTNLTIDLQKWYLKKFNNSNELLTNSSDIWFNYFCEYDIEKWTNFLEPIILRIIKNFEKSEYKKHCT